MELVRGERETHLHLTVLYLTVHFPFFFLSLMYGDVGLQELAHSPTAGVPATKRRKGRGGRVHRVWSPSGGEGGGTKQRVGIVND